MKLAKAFTDGGFHTALATTYHFDPLVFEQFLMVRLRAADCRNIAVLADRDMLNAALSETGPPAWAGTRYHLAKRAVAEAFHPKILLQLGETRGRLILGSANLTGAGIYGNLEAVSALETGETDTRAAPLLAAALAYIEHHADPADIAMRRAIDRARRWTPWLADVALARSVMLDGGEVSFVTEETPGGIGGAFAELAGGAAVTRLVCIAPYWDKTLSALGRLRGALGTPPTQLVVDAGGQEFDAETLGALSEVSVHSGEALPGARISEAQVRRLHAKIVIACTDAADIVLTGSANMSLPGLFGAFETTGNAEAGLIRREPPGTAITRLGLDPCLSIPMPPAALHLRIEDDSETICTLRARTLWVIHELCHSQQSMP
jgi:hypothetical protein